MLHKRNSEIGQQKIIINQSAPVVRWDAIFNIFITLDIDSWNLKNTLRANERFHKTLVYRISYTAYTYRHLYAPPPPPPPPHTHTDTNDYEILIDTKNNIISNLSWQLHFDLNSTAALYEIIPATITDLSWRVELVYRNLNMRFFIPPP